MGYVSPEEDSAEDVDGDADGDTNDGVEGDMNGDANAPNNTGNGSDDNLQKDEKERVDGMSIYQNSQFYYFLFTNLYLIELKKYNWQTDGVKSVPNTTYQRRYFRCSNWNKPDRQSGCKARYGFYCK